MKKLTDEELYKIAEKRVHAKKDLITHLITYIATCIGLAVINYLITPGYYWVLIVIFGWGISIVIQGVKTYSILNMEDDAVQKEIEKLKKKGL